jgi:hypothetical protein
MLQDVRFGLRTFLKNPRVALIAVLGLALATGATAAIFSIVDGVLLRPMPLGDPDSRGADRGVVDAARRSRTRLRR